MESGYGSRLSGDVDQFSRKSISTPSIAMTSAFVAALIVIVLPCPASSSIFYQKSPLARFASQSPPGCTYQGVKYQNGEQVITSEPCLNCTCKRGVLSCFLKVCPTIMYHPNEQNCPTVREPGSCCPAVKCAGSDPTTTTTLATTTLPASTSSTTTGVLVPSSSKQPEEAGTSESEESRSGTSTTLVQTTSPVPIYVASNQALNYNPYKDEESNNYTQSGNDVFTSYSSLPTKVPNASNVPASTTPVNGLLSDVNGLSVATTTGLKVTSASAPQLQTTNTSSPNKYTVYVKDNTTIFETSPATIVHDSPKFVTSSVTPQPDSRSDPSENELLESGGCSLNGTMYAEGSAVISSSFCEYCYCIRGRRMCIRPRCHLSLMDCLPRYTSEYACCPTSYACGISALTSSGYTNWTALDSLTTSSSTTSTTTTLAPSTSSSTQVFRTCREKGSQYRLGEKMTSNKTCQNCYCSYGGVKKCRQIQCSPPIPGCSAVTPPGHCCPTEYKCNSSDQEKKPNLRKEDPTLASIGEDETTTDSVKDMTTTLSPHLPDASDEVSLYKLRGQAKVEGPLKDSLELELIEDGSSGIDDPVANPVAAVFGREEVVTEDVSADRKTTSEIHPSIEPGKLPILSTPGPVSSSASPKLEGAVEKKEDDQLQSSDASSDSTQLYTFSPSLDNANEQTKKELENGKVIGSSSPVSLGKEKEEIMDMNQAIASAATTSVPSSSTTTNNVTNSSLHVTEVVEVTPSPPNTHLESIQMPNSGSQVIFSSSDSTHTNPSPSSTSAPSHPPPPTTLPELVEVKIQPNQLYATWKSGTSAAAAPSNEVNEDRDRVEIILDGIIHALDQRLNEELPSEPRVEDKNKKVAEEGNETDERKKILVAHKAVASRKEDDSEDEFQLPPIATGYITNLDSLSNKGSTHHKSNPSAFKNALPNIPPSLLNSAVGKIQVSSMIGFASDSPRKPSDSHSVQPGSASFLVVDDPSLEYKKGSVSDADSAGGVEIITAKTPFLEAENISDSDSFLINLSPTTLKVGSSSPNLYSMGSVSSDSTYDSSSPWTSNNRAPEKPMANFPTYYGSSTNQWKIVSQNHGPTGKSPKSSDDDSLYYTDQLSKRTGLAPTSEALASEPEKRGRLEDTLDGESSLHASPGYTMIHPFGSNDGLGHHSPPESYSHQHSRRPNGSSFARVRVPTTTESNADYHKRGRGGSCLVDGKEYPNGSMIPKKVADPCSVCGCFNGREMCQPQSCPGSPEPHCKGELQPGSCCPRYLCPSTSLDSVVPEASPLTVSHADPSAGSRVGHETEITVKDLYIRSGIPNLPTVPSHVHGFQGRPPPMRLDPTSMSLASNPFPQPGQSPHMIHFPHETTSVEHSRPPGMFLGTPTNAFLPPNRHGLPQGPPTMYSDKNHGNRPRVTSQTPQPTRHGHGPVIGPPAGYMSASSNILVHQEPPQSRPPLSYPQLSQKASPYPYTPKKEELVPTSTSTTTEPSVHHLSSAPTLAVDTPDKTVLEQIMNAATAWVANVTQVPLSAESTGTSSATSTTTSSPVATSDKPIWKVSPPEQLIFSGSSSTTPKHTTTLSSSSTTTTTTTSSPTTSKSSNPWDLLRVSGCNIYGTFYNVDESINELSTACKKCFCSAFGVQCSKIC